MLLYLSGSSGFLFPCGSGEDNSGSGDENNLQFNDGVRQQSQLQDQFEILAFGESYGHQGAVVRTAWPEGQIVQELPGRLRCSACGARECSIRIVFSGAGLAKGQDSADVLAQAVNGNAKNSGRSPGKKEPGAKPGEV